ncbi:type II toxin-antitoxin system RelE/ParE family toxin [Candidatus Woesearchaeota archaeon]|nr:type II toxin-antitoxin system RelE/ParE family toxin [Candidatus Woesearchaeota archaeon]
MTWKVEWHPRAFRNLEGLPKQLIARIVKKLDETAQDPFRFLEHYEGDTYKLRIGDYRALVDVDYSTATMLVMHFDHRKKVYK